MTNKQFLSKLFCFAGLIPLMTGCKERYLHPQDFEWYHSATLITPQRDRCHYVPDRQELVTLLHFDTDGNPATVEYMGLDSRNVRTCGQQNLNDYREAIESLECGERKTLLQWKNVTPNIVLYEYCRN
ncbi:MAG: hypothetical protein IJC11_01755 [Alphaproteobacteria bacterium]|nr:hypothetical protein [Alphaproteobacteria bacterium]MBQ3117033.1 hypothetical protein [Alphaproteobacteria bacterium]MBQ6854611.1 hypothetical protein [Alphaproteobacteria bacterium]MBR3913470.1 hypothetical protein [Alphaproteobacteria bacterium]